MIPKIIHRTVPKETTPLMDYCWETVKKYTPDYVHMTHYDDDEYTYINDSLPLCDKGAFRADLIRLEVLYKYGGIYFDSDIELYSPIDDLLDNEIFICKQDDEHVINVAIGSMPGNEIILEMLNMSMRIIKSGKLVYPYLFNHPKYSTKYLAAFGPFVAHWCTIDKQDITFLDSTSFDLNWHKEKTGGVYGKHHCAGSWLSETIGIKLEEELIDTEKNLRNIVSDVFNVLIPKDKVFSRIGSYSDGGYVTVNDFSENDYLLSFGVQDNVDFENAISPLVFGMDLYDYSIDNLPKNIKNSKFYKEKIGSSNRHVFDRLPKNKDIILKSDIEGGEWDFFESLSHAAIHRFRQIIIETHWGIQNNQINSPEIRLDIIQKINKTHQLVSIHPNNWSGICYVDGVSIPQVMELTFLRKADYIFVEGAPPKNLFSPNHPQRVELEFDIDKKYKEVYDNYLGNVVFPLYDTLISQDIDKNGVHEKNEFNWIMENVKEGDTCINIGSNVGYFTCVMSRKVGRKGKVFSIEANPSFEYFLNENIKRTNIDNVSVIMSAAGNTKGIIDLFINSENCGDNRVFDPNIINSAPYEMFSKEKTITSVPINKVDNIVLSEEVHAVLIDCQGWDHEVIRGMNDIIKKHKPKILTEFIPKWIESLGEKPIDILNEYISYGYDLLFPDLGLNLPCDPQKILNLMKEKNIWFTNVYLRKKGE